MMNKVRLIFSASVRDATLQGIWADLRTEEIKGRLANANPGGILATRVISTGESWQEEQDRKIMSMTNQLHQKRGAGRT
jgi:hypothetical protein